MTCPSRILLLAGTFEARRIARLLATMPGLEVTASLAGRVTGPATYPVPVVCGGFGGATGLAERLERDSIDLLVDATHPFAVTITANAVKACAMTGTRMIGYARPPWQAGRNDRWLHYATLEHAILAIPGGSRVFAPLGSGVLDPPARQLIAGRPDLEFVLRLIEPAGKAVPDNVIACLGSRPAEDWQSEAGLLRQHRCDRMLCRNAGGTAGAAKLRAAAELGLEVYMVSRPPMDGLPAGLRLFTDATMLAAWIGETEGRQRVE